MLLGEILHPAVITTDLAANEKFEAIDELIEMLVESGDIRRDLREHVSEVVIAREVSMSTGMEQGIALPHGSTNRVDRVLGALGISREGIAFDSLDGKPAHIIVLLVLPRDELQVHARTLAGISHLLNDDAFRISMLQASNEAGLMEIIRNEERASLFDRFRWRFQ